MIKNIERRGYRIDHLVVMFGLSKATIYRLIKAGEFPSPVKVGGDKSRAVIWLSKDITAWEENLQESGGLE